MSSNCYPFKSGVDEEEVWKEYVTILRNYWNKTAQPWKKALNDLHASRLYKGLRLNNELSSRWILVCSLYNAQNNWAKNKDKMKEILAPPTPFLGKR